MIGFALVAAAQCGLRFKGTSNKILATECCLGKYCSAEKPRPWSYPGKAEVSIELERCVVPIPGEGGLRDLLQPLTHEVPYMVQ